MRIEINFFHRINFTDRQKTLMHNTSIVSKELNEIILEIVFEENTPFFFFFSLKKSKLYCNSDVILNTAGAIY